MRLHRVFLLILALAIPGIVSVGAQASLPEDYACPEQTEVRSSTPFTLDAIESVLGFSAPGLDDLVAMPLHSLLPEPYYFFYLACTPQNNSTFVALLYPLTETRMRLRAFQLEGLQVVIDASLDDVQSQWLPHLMGVSGFADRNFNGLPDLVVRGEDGAKEWFSGMHIMELSDDQVLRDITPVGGEIGPDRFDDIDGDGIPELMDAQYFAVPMTPHADGALDLLNHWWTWNSAGYQTFAVEVSAFPRSEQTYPNAELDSGERIEAYLNTLSPEQICAQVAQETREYGDLRWRLFHIMMYYDAWGDLNAGREKIHPIGVSAEACPESDGKTIFTFMVDVIVRYFDAQ